MCFGVVAVVGVFTPPSLTPPLLFPCGCCLCTLRTPSPDFAQVLRGAEEQSRMEALLHLAYLLKCEPSNVVAWLQQPGWQMWLLDLFELEDEAGVLFDAASAVNMRGGPTPSLQPAPTGAGGVRGGGSTAPASSVPVVGPEHGSGVGGASSASSSIAGDILALLVVAALELERGWRVWLPTLGCMRQRFGPAGSLQYVRC